MIEQGYYWAEHTDGTYFVVYHEDQHWYCMGLEHPIEFNPDQIICAIPDPSGTNSDTLH